jgi:hypothetical protein
VKEFEKKVQLSYKSDTRALGKFLNDLSRSSSGAVWVRSYKPGRNASWAPANSNWSVFYSPFANRFTVKSRLDSDIDLTELYIPPLRAERRGE